MRGLATILADALGRRPRTEVVPGIRLTERSIRALLHRLHPLDCERIDDGLVRIDARDAADALERTGRRAMREPIPNRTAGAPRRDRAALAALARRCRAGDDVRGATNGPIDLQVPEAVSRWTALRHARMERVAADPWGDHDGWRG